MRRDMIRTSRKPPAAIPLVPARANDDVDGVPPTDRVVEERLEMFRRGTDVEDRRKRQRPVVRPEPYCEPYRLPQGPNPPRHHVKQITGMNTGCQGNSGRVFPAAAPISMIAPAPQAQPRWFIEQGASHAAS